MKIAVISDLHGNLKALDYFINYIDKEKIETVLNLGDILGGLNPIEALRIIKKDKRFINVCGNHDKELEFLKDDLTKDDIDFLKGIPLSRVFECFDKKFLMVHSRKNSNKDIPVLYNEGNLMEFLTDYEGEWDYVLFGHTHYQCYLSFYDGKIMINPGSLGLSYDNKISFAIITIENDEFNLEFKKIKNWEYN